MMIFHIKFMEGVLILKSCIRKEIEKLYKKYKTKDPKELCSYLDIKIIYENLGSINGYFQSSCRIKIIHLNTNLEENFSRFVLAHELGHAILHEKLNLMFLETNTFDLKDKYERQANIFAAELLLDDTLKNIYYESNCTVNEIACIEKVPVELVKYKFNLT